jgi:hypothetical protein
VPVIEYLVHPEVNAPRVTDADSLMYALLASYQTTYREAVVAAADVGRMDADEV